MKSNLKKDKKVAEDDDNSATAVIGKNLKMSPETALIDYTEQVCALMEKVTMIYDRTIVAVFKENRKFCHPEFEHLVESSNIIRHILTHMDKKMFYCMNTDQWPYFSAPSYIMVDFMGQRTRTMSGGATVANKYSLAVTYLSMTRREGNKKYEMEFKTICDNASTMTVQQIMDRYYELLESDIRKDPGNYLWSHKRWKKC